MTARNNEEWLQLIATRDPTAMTELWSMIIEWGLTSAYKRQQSEDLGRDAAVRAFVRITHNLGGFSGDGTFVGWCRVIVVREVLRLLEIQQRQVSTLDDPATALDELSSGEIPVQIDPASIRGRLQPCIDALKKREKQVIERFYYQEQTPQMLAEAMQIQINNVHQLLHRARKQLQTCLKRLGFAGVEDVLSL